MRRLRRSMTLAGMCVCVCVCGCAVHAGSRRAGGAAFGSVEGVGGSGAAGLADEFQSAILRSAQDAAAAACGGACEGQGVVGPGARPAQGWRPVWASGRGSRGWCPRTRSMRSSITVPTLAAGAATSSWSTTSARSRVRPPPGRGVAADQRDPGRASHSPVALSGVPRQDDCRVALRGRLIGVRA